MNLKYYYYYFQNALTPRFCDELIEYGKSSKKKLGLTGFNEEQAEELKKKNKTEYKKYLNNVIKKRNSNVVWLNDRWIYKEIQPYVYKANKLAGWNFHWDYSENCQFTIYKKNQFYEWHTDAFEEPFNEIENKNKHGKIRKLSVTCSLSDPKDYEGGELEFDFRNVSPDKPTNLKKCTEILPRGSIIVFPSHVWHRVNPVTKGTRYSLVVWNIGHPFR